MDELVEDISRYRRAGAVQGRPGEEDEFAESGVAVVEPVGHAGELRRRSRTVP